MKGVGDPVRYPPIPCKQCRTPSPTTAEHHPRTVAGPPTLGGAAGSKSRHPSRIAFLSPPFGRATGRRPIPGFPSDSWLHGTGWWISGCRSLQQSVQDRSCLLAERKHAAQLLLSLGQPGFFVLLCLPQLGEFGFQFVRGHFGIEGLLQRLRVGVGFTAKAIGAACVVRRVSPATAPTADSTLALSGHHFVNSL